jgi:uncharacterized protein (UPF0548 family)
MSHGLLWLQRPTDAQLLRVLEKQSRLPVSYDPVGMTQDENDHFGYRRVGDFIELSGGPDAFETATQALRHWQMHERAGLRVLPEKSEVAVDSSVVMVFHALAAYVTLACRIVYIIDTPGQWGFAYGTLPHHPERGEERFVVSIEDDERVRFTVSALSRPGHPLTAISTPAARMVQRSMTKRYLRAMAGLVGSRNL